MDVHDAHALQPSHRVIEVFAHAADLAIEPLGQHDAKRVAPDLRDLARIRHRAEDRHTRCHAVEEILRQRSIDRDDVFLFVLVLRAQHAVDDVAVVRQQDQPLGILVEAPDRKDALAMPDEVHDVVRHLAVRRAFDADRLVEGQVEALRLCEERLAVDEHLVVVIDLRAEHRHRAIDADPAGLDPLVGFASRADPGFAQVLVEPHLAQPPARRTVYPSLPSSATSRSR
jgi:hypothetical protein